MKFLASLIGYQLVWFAAVIGSAHGLAWPGVVGMLFYAACQLVIARHYKVDLSLMATAIVLAMVVDGGLIRMGLANYAVPWPSASWAPAWIVALWVTFALTFTQSLRWLQERLWLAALLGAIGGPLAYLGASRGWQVVSFTPPAWHGLLWLAIGWMLATPMLAWLARRWSNEVKATSISLRGDTP
ncbi:MAG: DUF2878 domain-containing protein [Dyella sp.]